MKKIISIVLIAFALSLVSDATARSRFAHSKNGKVVQVSHKKKHHRKHQKHHRGHHHKGRRTLSKTKA